MTLEKDIKEFVCLLKLKEFCHYNNGSGEADEGIEKPSSDFVPSKVTNPVLLSVCDTLV